MTRIIPNIYEVSGIAHNTTNATPRTEEALAVIGQAFLSQLYSSLDESPDREIGCMQIVRALNDNNLNDVAIDVRKKSAEIRKRIKREKLERVKEAPYVSKNFHLVIAKLMVGSRPLDGFSELNKNPNKFKVINKPKRVPKMTRPG